jgi:hypothetical protein
MSSSWRYSRVGLIEVPEVRSWSWVAASPLVLQLFIEFTGLLTGKAMNQIKPG